MADACQARVLGDGDAAEHLALYNKLLPLVVEQDPQLALNALLLTYVTVAEAAHPHLCQVCIEKGLTGALLSLRAAFRWPHVRRATGLARPN